MLKCKYNDCRWPECEKTCGLVPPGDYAVGSCPEEGLIYELQRRIEQLQCDAVTARVYANRLRGNLNMLLDAIPSSSDYERVCPYEYMDCVYDPGYLRKYHPETWEKMGMPITCGETCGGKDGGYCNEYDLEDK